MKKQLVLGLALMVGLFTFAQKKELKAAEKAIKSNNYADAKSEVKNAEAFLSVMDDKTRAKYYFLNGQALYANGTGSDTDIREALNSFKMVEDIEVKSGKKTYTLQIDALKVSMSNAFLKKASNALEQKKYKIASNNYERAYRVSAKDTMYLYNSALLATSSKNFDKAIEFYNELISLGYTGISVEFMATEIETGEEQTFPNQITRDISIKAGTHEKSRNVKSKSKSGEMAKNIALIYIELGENEKAIVAINKAKEASPNDIDLILSEANVYYKMDNIEKYKELILKVLEINPNDANLLFNLGVFAAEEKDFVTARSYYSKALEIDPTYNKARLNTVALLFDEVEIIVEEMNNLGMSAAENKKYDELNAKKDGIYKSAIPYLKEVLEIDPKNLSASKTLKEIYGVLGDDPNFKAMKAKVEALENEN